MNDIDDNDGDYNDNNNDDNNNNDKGNKDDDMMRIILAITSVIMVTMMQLTKQKKLKIMVITIWLIKISHLRKK